MNPNEQKAAELLASWQKWDRNIAYWISEVIVPKLAMPDHEAALAACEEMALRYPIATPWDSLDGGDAAAIGRRSLDAKKPKVRWTCDPDGIVCCDGKTVLKFYTPCAAKDARAYAADMNAKEAGR